MGVQNQIITSSNYVCYFCHRKLDIKSFIPRYLSYIQYALFDAEIQDFKDSCYGENRYVPNEICYYLLLRKFRVVCC